MSGHDQTLFLQLLGNITGTRARNLNPGLGEHGTGGEHEQDVDSGVKRVDKSVGEVEGRRHVVRDTRHSVELSRSFLGLPDTEETNEKVFWETVVQHL